MSAAVRAASSSIQLYGHWLIISCGKQTGDGEDRIWMMNFGRRLNESRERRGEMTICSIIFFDPSFRSILCRTPHLCVSPRIIIIMIVMIGTMWGWKPLAASTVHAIVWRTTGTNRKMRITKTRIEKVLLFWCVNLVLLFFSSFLFHAISIRIRSTVPSLLPSEYIPDHSCLWRAYDLILTNDPTNEITYENEDISRLYEEKREGEIHESWYIVYESEKRCRKREEERNEMMVRHFAWGSDIRDSRCREPDIRIPISHHHWSDQWVVTLLCYISSLRISIISFSARSFAKSASLDCLLMSLVCCKTRRQEETEGQDRKGVSRYVYFIHSRKKGIMLMLDFCEKIIRYLTCWETEEWQIMHATSWWWRKKKGENDFRISSLSSPPSPSLWFYPVLTVNHSLLCLLSGGSTSTSALQDFMSHSQHRITHIPLIIYPLLPSTT